MEYELFSDVFNALNLSDDFLVWEDKWNVSTRLFRDRKETFPEPDIIERACRFLRIEPEIADAIQVLLRNVKTIPPLVRLLWHRYCQLCFPEMEPEENRLNWPVLPTHLGDDMVPMAYIFSILPAVFPLRERHRKLGIPENVTVTTLQDLSVRLKWYKKEHGRWGDSRWGWYNHHFDPDSNRALYGLHRLQYEFRTLSDDVFVYGHRDSGKRIIFPGSGHVFREDGQYNGTNGIYDHTTNWESIFELNESQVRANTVLRNGRAWQESVTLNLEDWFCLLKKGDPVLSVHIPASGPLNPVDCMVSYQQAIAFYLRYFPHCLFKAFCSNSWLFDYQLASILPSCSNIVHFQSAWMLLPSPNASDAQTIERVFGEDVDDPVNVVAQTSLQRMIVEQMKQGRRFRNGASLLFPEDIRVP